MSENPNSTNNTPGETIEAIAKTMYKQAKEYGFSNNDFIKFVNLILDLAFDKSKLYTPLSDINRDSSLRLKGVSSHNFKIVTPHISIKRYKSEDFELLNEWVNHEDSREFLSTRIQSNEPDNLGELIDSPNSMFGMVLLDENPIGALAFLNIDREQKKAELRKLISDPKSRGKGFAREATQYWIEYGVTILGLRKIYLHTLNKNLANIKLNEKLGFRVEGILRDECYFDEQYHDLLRMGLIIK